MSEYFNSIKSNDVYNAFVKDKNKIIFTFLHWGGIVTKKNSQWRRGLSIWLKHKNNSHNFWQDSAHIALFFTVSLGASMIFAQGLLQQTSNVNKRRVLWSMSSSFPYMYAGILTEIQASPSHVGSTGHRSSIQDINTLPHHLASVGNSLLPGCLHSACLQNQYYINNNVKFCCQLKTRPGPLHQSGSGLWTLS